MKKENRVKSKQDFQKVIQNKRKFASNNYVIYYLHNDDQTHARFGVSASKKLGDAVTRVKVRRQIRAMIREMLSEMEVKPLDYVVIVRPTYKIENYHDNLKELKKSFIKFGGKK